MNQYCMQAYYSELHKKWVAGDGPYIRFSAKSKAELKAQLRAANLKPEWN